MWDVIVVGCGGAGLSLLWELSTRGHRVLGLEAASDALNTQANSSSSSRGHRQTYEDPLYRSLARRSAGMWSALSPEQPLFHQCGAWLTGPREHPMLASVQRTLAHTGDPHKLCVDHDTLRVCPEGVAIWEPQAGWIDAQGAMYAWRSQALAAGAHLLIGAHVVRAEYGAQSASVELNTGASYSAKQVVWCTGAALDLSTYNVEVKTEHQTEFWCDVPHSFRVPMFHTLEANGEGCFGILERPGRLKICLHGVHEPEHGASQEEMLRALARAVPSLTEVRVVRASVKTRAMTSNHEFIVGPTNSKRTEWIFGGLCGHGFKMLPALAHDLATALVEGGVLPEWAQFSPQLTDM